MHIFELVLRLAMTLMHFYVFLRAASFPGVTKHISRRQIAWGAGILWVLVLYARIYCYNTGGEVGAILEIATITWMVSLFLISIPLAVVDLITGFGLWARSIVPMARGIALGVGLVLCGVAVIQGVRPPVVVSEEVTLPGLPAALDGKVLVAASDLHIGPLLGKAWLAKRISQINALSPDLVAIPGDLFEGDGPPREDIPPVLKTLSAPLGVWVVPGNHEFNRNQKENLDAITEAGFHLLRNEWKEAAPGLMIAGVDDLSTARRIGGGEAWLASALAHRPEGATILLSHSPLMVETAARQGVGLMLCGHTHDGQVWPVGYLLRFLYSYISGRYTVDGMPLIVSRGAGEWGARMRLWRPGEILRITLRGEGMECVKGAKVPEVH